MANKIQIKRNSSGTPSGLSAGELAVNTADGKLWVGNTAEDGVLHLNNHLPLDGGILTSTSQPVLKTAYNANHFLGIGHHYIDLNFSSYTTIWNCGQVAHLACQFIGQQATLHLVEQ